MRKKVARLITIFILLLYAAGIFYIMNKSYAIGVFDLLWGVFLIVCHSDLAKPSYSKTALVLAAMITCVNLGYVLGNIKIVAGERKEPAKPSVTYQDSAVTYLLLCSMLILLFYTVRTLVSFGLNLNLIRAANNSDSENKVFSGLLDTILYYGAAIPVLYAAALSVAYNFSQNIKTPRRIYAILAVNVLLYVINSGGRTMLLRIALFFAAALLWKLHGRSGTQKIKKSHMIAAAVAVYLVLNIVTSSRNTKDITFLQQALDYMKGSIAHMNYQLGSLNDRVNYYGYVTYGGFFYYPLKLVKAIFGWNLATSNEIMEFLQDYTYLRVGDRSVYYNALVPNAFYYYFDLGYVGVVLFSLILGYTAKRSEQAYQAPSFLRFVLWAASFYAMAYSVFGGALWSYTLPTAILYCVLLHNVFYRKVTNKHGRVNQCHYTSIQG